MLKVQPLWVLFPDPWRCLFQAGLRRWWSSARSIETTLWWP